MKAFFLKLEVNLRSWIDLSELRYLLHDIDGLNYLCGNIFVDGNCETNVRKVLIFTQDILRMLGCFAR